MFVGWWKRWSAAGKWRTRSMGVALAAVTAVAGALVTAGPAYADEPGLFCTITSSATLSASPSHVVYGQQVTVQWNLRLSSDCPEPVFYIVGPGFGGDIPTSGSRSVPAVGDPYEVTWSLYLYDIETDFRTPILMASDSVVIEF